MLSVMDQVVDVHWVAARLGITRQRVQQLTQRDDWPADLGLHVGKVWDVEVIEAWIREHRPEKATPPEGL
jgi:hypothetical protein